MVWTPATEYDATILLVDDDHEFSSALKAVLCGAGFAVRVANDGAIVDLNLPEVNGFEVIGAITRRPTAMRVVATSGVYQPTYLEIAQHLGASVSIPKTNNPDDLNAWIPAIRSILKAEEDIGSASG
jgi:CheY-like chemotaxis protein